MTDSSSTIPPYMSFGVFKTTIERLTESTVPTGALDRRVLDGLSGADYGSLMSGLKFLGLIDDNRVATTSFRGLVNSSKDGPKFKQALLGLITTTYKPIIGKVDIKGGTLAELEKAFKGAGVSAGQMLTKTIRFYVKALTESGAEISPYITQPKPRAARAPRSATKTKTGGRPSGSGDDPFPAGTERMPIPGIAEAFIQYPANLTEAQCDLLDAMVGVLRAFAKGRAGGKRTKP